MLSRFYEKNLKDKPEFQVFIHKFLEKILPDYIDKAKYVQSVIKYLFYDEKTFLYELKYFTFREVNSDYLQRVFKSFLEYNVDWVNFLWNMCDDKETVKHILAILGNKKLEVVETIVMPSFKSLENDETNSEIVTHILNSILKNMQELQQQQNTMFANVSHEMRTPLNSVIGYLDILDNMKTLTIEERKYISYAKNSSKILLTLINDLLDTQKLNNASLDLTNNPFWVNKTIKSAVLISSVNAKQKNIELLYEDNINLFSEVIGDKNRFLQILNNILSNAVKFTPEKGKIEIKAKHKVIGSKVEVLVSVQDNGMGIPRDKQRDLFKPFSRATNKEKGTGLGLFISKQLAQKMGGDIWFESEENKGTIFYIKVVFEQSENLYSETLLKGRKIVLFRASKYESIYCKNLKKQLEVVGANVTLFREDDKFLQFLMFNTEIDIVIVIYPNEIEKNDMDVAFIKTYKELYKSQNTKTYFVAGLEENTYPKNHFIYDKMINLPITVLDIMELFGNNIKSDNYRYLIVDDEPMNRMVLTTMIKTLDKEAIIDTAIDGAEGIDKIKHNHYDVIFLDKRMPKMTGYEVLEKLEKLGIEANIYLLTADGDSDTIAKTQEHNIGYIAKPVTLNTIKSIISTLAGGGRHRR